MKNTLRLSVIASCGLLIFFFFLVVYGHLFSEGLGAADDAFIAIVAKNLSMGYGYSYSGIANETDGIFLFHPGINTGPPLILPAAGLIKVFGNQPWVPGLVTPTISIILLLLIFQQTVTRHGWIRSLLFTTLMIGFSYLFTTRRLFALWFSLLGEIPSVLLSILGTILLVAHDQKKTKVIVGSLLLGLAVQTKMIALLTAIPVLIMFLTHVLKKSPINKNKAASIALPIVFFVAPFLLFEIWKVAVLGITGYEEHLFISVKAFKTVHGVPPLFTGYALPKMLLERSEILHNHFGCGIPFLLAGLVILLILIYRYGKNDFSQQFCYVLFISAFLHLTWWLLFSNGNPRYALMGIFLYFTAVSGVVFLTWKRMLILTVTGVFAIWMIAFNPGFFNRVLFLAKFQFGYTPRVTNLIRTASFLEGLKNDHKNVLFVSGWWATCTDLEFLLPEVNNFKRFDHLTPADFQKEIILVRNSRWEKVYQTPGLKEWALANTKILWNAPPYMLSRYKH
jgi:hypothetical protein